MEQVSDIDKQTQPNGVVVYLPWGNVIVHMTPQPISAFPSVYETLTNE